MKKRDKYVILAMGMIVAFTIAVLAINANDHEVSDSLIVGWFAAWTVELALLAGIKLKSKEDE